MPGSPGYNLLAQSQAIRVLQQKQQRVGNNCVITIQVITMRS